MPSEHLISFTAVTSPEHTVTRVFGQPVIGVPQDLSVPPDMLKTILNSFQGSLDSLLYLICKQNIDVLDIPMVKIAKQYLHYIAQVETYRFDLATEYLLMAVMLTKTRSRLLLPRSGEVEDEEVDPRAELVRHLLIREQVKLATQGLDALPHAGRGFTQTYLLLEVMAGAKLPEVYVADSTQAWPDISSRVKRTRSHEVVRETTSVRAQTMTILRRLNESDVSRFSDLFKPEQGVTYAAISFTALLKLVKEGLVHTVQPGNYGEIEISLEDGLEIDEAKTLSDDLEISKADNRCLKKEN